MQSSKGELMFQRDYLMRMIEQFSVGIARIVFQIENRQFEQARQTMEQAFRSLVGLNANSIHTFSVKDLIAFMAPGGVPDLGKGIVLSDLLKEEGTLYFAQNEPEQAHRSYVKAMDLLLELWLIDDRNMKEIYISRIKQLITKLDTGDKSYAVNNKLMAYYELSGRYAKAEDTLYRLREYRPGDEELLEKGMQLYARLLQMNHEDLIAGNLPIAEVQAGLEQWLRK
jgi:tetratricopeptide (TPR) repeat protein